VIACPLKTGIAEKSRSFRSYQRVAGMLLPQSLLEADTRVILLTLAGWVVLAAISVQAAPLPPSKATLDELTAPPIEPVARGRDAEKSGAEPQPNS
jgi:hypothetical protein